MVSTAVEKVSSYVMPGDAACDQQGADVWECFAALPRKQFQDVLARSVSQPNSAMPNLRSAEKAVSDMGNSRFIVLLCCFLISIAVLLM